MTTDVLHSLLKKMKPLLVKLDDVKSFCRILEVSLHLKNFSWNLLRQNNLKSYNAPLLLPAAPFSTLATCQVPNTAWYMRYMSSSITTHTKQFRNNLTFWTCGLKQQKSVVQRQAHKSCPSKIHPLSWLLLNNVMLSKQNQQPTGFEKILSDNGGKGLFFFPQHRKNTVLCV